MRKNDIIRILTVVFAVLIAALVIGGGTYLITASKKIQALTITPGFADTELGVDAEYTFIVSATPSKAKLKKVKCKCDDPNSTFEFVDDGKAVLRTGINEGTVTVYVEYKDIKSNVMTFQIVDLVAQAQAQAAAEEAARAEAEAAAAAEAEAAAAAEEEYARSKQYVKMTGDNVNVRSQDNTNCDILGKAKKDDTFELVEVVGDWSHIIYNGQDGYIKSEFLAPATAEDVNGGAEAAATTEENKPATETATQNTTENNTAQENNNAEAAATAAAEAAAAQAAAELQAQQEAAMQAAAAAAAAAAVGTPIHCKDGTCYVTAAQLNKIHATWDFAGDAIEMAGHHSIGELEAVIGPTQH